MTFILAMYVTFTYIKPLFYSYLVKREGERREKINVLQQEIATLDSLLQVKHKAIPDSLKTEQHDASHNLMYVEEGSDGYWDAKGSIRRAQEEIDRLCPDCKKLREEIEAKQKELEELF